MGRPRKFTCAWPGCTAAKHNGKAYCKAHLAEDARNRYRKRHPPRKSTDLCVEPGCSAPRHKHYTRCHTHAQAKWRRDSEQLRRQRGVKPRVAKTEVTVRILLTDYGGDVIQEFIATPVGKHPMPELEGQRKAMLAKAQRAGALVAIIE